MVTLPPAPPALAAVSVWLLLKAFASGCTAMTGVEAVSQRREGLPRADRRKCAPHAGRHHRTAHLDAGWHRLPGACLRNRRHGPRRARISERACDAGGSGGRQGIFYYVTIGSILLVLALSANTAFADFPRLCKTISHDGFLPRSFGSRGRRLVYSQGVYVLAALAAVLLIVFGGVTDRLIPLFAVGAFLAFTLSQAGMVFHWKRIGGGGARRSMLVNGLGAVATAVTVVVVLVAKFLDGAWITLLLVPGLLAVMIAVRRQYHHVRMNVGCQSPLELDTFKAPLVLVPLDHWNKIAKRALTFALTISPDVTALHIDSGERTTYLREEWYGFVDQPVLQLGMAPPKLVILPSPYRFVITPIVDYVLELAQKNPSRQIAVVIPEVVERRWYYHMLHNQRGTELKSMLYFKGNGRIIVVNVPWYVEGD
jgi:hypothetical protein